MIIDSEVLRNRIYKVLSVTTDENFKAALYSVIDIIDDMPRADAIPIRWLQNQLNFAEEYEFNKSAEKLWYVKELWEEVAE